MKVAKDFFCIKEKKAYKIGDEYKGKRTDINHILDIDIKVKGAKQIKAK